MESDERGEDTPLTRGPHYRNTSKYFQNSGGNSWENSYGAKAGMF